MWCDHVSLVSKLGQSLQCESREQAQLPDGRGPTGGPTVGAGLRDLTSAIRSSPPAHTLAHTQMHTLLRQQQQQQQHHC